MEKSNHQKQESHLNITGILLFAIVTVAILFRPCPAKEFTAEEEYNAQKKLSQLQTLVDEGDYLRAQFILTDFKKDFEESNCYKTYSKRINELTGKIRKEAKNIKYEDRIEYYFIPARLKTKLWKEYMGNAEMLVSQNKGIGIAVLRVSFEDEDIEKPSVGIDRNSDYQLNIYRGGGYSCVDTCQSGNAVYIGSQFWRCDPNDKDVSAAGDVIIGGIYHYPIRLKINVQRGKAVAIGEVLVRSVPKEFCGNLKVNVKAEEGLDPAGSIVRLRPSNFYSGKSETVKDSSCLFGSIGPGSYNAAIDSSLFNGPGSSAVVVSGQTSEITINAYRHRLIEFDWRFRDVNEPNSWLSGRKTMKTNESWQPDGEWPNVHYPVIAFSEWRGNTCNIRSSNGNIRPIQTNESFEKIDFPLNSGSFYSDSCPVKEGDFFAWYHDNRRGEILEALIRINKITPVEIHESSGDKSKNQK